MSFGQDTTFFSSQTSITKDKADALYYTLDKINDSCRVNLFDIKTSNKFASLSLQLKDGKGLDYYVLDGEVTYFHTNGAIKEVGKMENNGKTDLWQYFYPNTKPNKTLLFGTDIKYSSKYPFYYKILTYYNEANEQLVIDGNGIYTDKSDSLYSFTVPITNGMPNGKAFGITQGLEFNENYHNGEFMGGVLIKTDGSIIKYDTLEVNPEFEGGIKNMYKFLASNIEYPKDAQKAKKSGKVFVKFIVEKDGEIKNTEVLKGVFPSLDEEAERVIKLFSYKFSSGKQRGLPVRVHFTMPINFSLE